MEQFNEFKQNLDMFSGYLSVDPDIRYFESGKCKATFSIPLSKGKDSETLWLNCECWGRIAEKAGEELKKGSEVLVLGYFKEVEYEAKDKTKKKKIVFIVKGVI